MAETKAKQKAKEHVLETFKDSRETYRGMKNEYQELWELAHGIPKSKRGKFNRFIPYIPASIDLALPRLAGRLPKFEVIGVSPDDKEHSRSLQKLVEWYLDKINFHDFELKFIQSAITYGTAVAEIGWNFRVKPLHPDMIGVMSINDSRRLVDEPIGTLRPIEDVFPHKNKIEMQDEWPVVIRRKSSIRDLKRDNRIDKKALDNLGPVVDEDTYFSQLNKDTKVNSVGATSNVASSPTDSDTVVVLDYWGPYDVNDDGDDEECVITVVNWERVVRMEQNPFWHQRKPFVKLDYRPDAHRFFNDGLVKMLKDLQLELNDIRNTRAAARAISLKKPLMFDRTAGVNPDTLKFEDAALWPYDGTINPNPITPVEIPSKLLELENEEEAVKRDMQNRSGLNDVAIGTQDVGVTGGETATGASIAAEQTNLRFRAQAIFIDQAMKEIGEQFISNIQQFVNQPKVIRIIGEQAGQQWRKINPEDIQGQFDFHISPMSTFVEPKAAKRQQLLELKAIYAEDPTINHAQLDRNVFDLFDLDADLMIKSPDDQAMDSAATELTQVATAINDPSFEQLPPEEQSALAQRNDELMKMMGGAQPSPQAAPPEGGQGGTFR